MFCQPTKAMNIFRMMLLALNCFYVMKVHCITKTLMSLYSVACQIRHLNINQFIELTLLIVLFDMEVSMSFQCSRGFHNKHAFQKYRFSSLRPFLKIYIDEKSWHGSKLHKCLPGFAAHSNHKIIHNYHQIEPECECG